MATRAGGWTAKVLKIDESYLGAIKVVKPIRNCSSVFNLNPRVRRIAK